MFCLVLVTSLFRKSVLVFFRASSVAVANAWVSSTAGAKPVLPPPVVLILGPMGEANCFVGTALNGIGTNIFFSLVISVTTI